MPGCFATGELQRRAERAGLVALSVPFDLSCAHGILLCVPQLP